MQAQGEALEALSCLDSKLQAGQTNFYWGQWREVGHKFPVGSLLSSERVGPRQRRWQVWLISFWKSTQEATRCRQSGRAGKTSPSQSQRGMRREVCAALWSCTLLLAACKGMPCCLLCSLPWIGSRGGGVPSNSHARPHFLKERSQRKWGPFFLLVYLYQIAFWRKVGLLAWVSVREEIRFEKPEILRITYQWQSADKLQGIMLFIVEFGALRRDSMQINLTGVFISANIHSLYHIWYAWFSMCLLWQYRHKDILGSTVKII